MQRKKTVLSQRVKGKNYTKLNIKYKGKIDVIFHVAQVHIQTKTAVSCKENKFLNHKNQWSLNDLANISIFEENEKK